MAGIIARLRTAQAVIAGALLLLMVVMVFTGGVARLARQPINWTIDVATACFAWAAFLCADLAWRRNTLMALDVVPARLPPGPRRALFYLNHALIAGFLIYLAYAGLELAWSSRARSFQGIPWMSYAWVTLSLPAGALLLLATTIGKVRDRLREDGVLGRGAF